MGFDYRFKWDEAKGLEGKRVLITGGAGFIGSNLSYIVQNHGAEVVVLDDLSTGKIENLDILDHSRLRFIEGDIRNLDTCRKAVDGVDFVFHLAACASVPKSVDMPIYAHEVNATGSLNVLIASRDAKVKRVVLASSCALYGDSNEPIQHEELLPIPLSPYASQKLVMESYARNFYQLFGLETVSMRFFNVFGPQQDPNSDYAAVIPKFVSLLVEGKQPRIFGDGEQTRDFIFVADVAQGLIRALFAEKAAGEVINLGSGTNTSVNRLFEVVRNTVGKDIEPIYEPPRPGDVRHSRANIDKLTSLLDFKPRFSFEDGLRMTVEWFASRL